jgi:hypothetical protein
MGLYSNRTQTLAKYLVESDGNTTYGEDSNKK